ncbi:MAG: hypothetical protein IT210_18170 [Armatimonadetes bacterium]|nr:hypothetical protein [Armatimonadota bacterium]
MPSLGILFSAQARSYQPWGDLFSTSDSGPYEWIIQRYGGAILKCAGSHILDLIMHLMGRPESVSADIDCIPGSMVDRRATALFSYPGSLAVQFEASAHPLSRIGYERNSWDEWLEINGTEGRLNLYTVMWDRPENNAALLIHYNNRLQTSTEYRFPAMNPFDAEIAAFHEAMKGGQPVRPDVVDGFNVDALIAAIEEAHRAGRRLLIDWRGL